MGDLISREKAIDAIEHLNWYHVSENGKLVCGANSTYDKPLFKAYDIYNALNGIPEENKWIPCSERLPEIPEGKQYVTVLCYSRIHFVPDHVDEQDWYYGYEIATYFKDFGWERLNDVIEWMYLPEPPELPKEESDDNA